MTRYHCINCCETLADCRCAEFDAQHTAPPSRIHDEAAYNAYWKDVDERAERKAAGPQPGFLRVRQAE